MATGFADLAVGANDLTGRTRINRLGTDQRDLTARRAAADLATGNSLISADDFPRRRLGEFGAAPSHRADFDGDAYAGLCRGGGPAGDLAAHRRGPGDLGSDGRAAPPERSWPGSRRSWIRLSPTTRSAMNWQSATSARRQDDLAVGAERLSPAAVDGWTVPLRVGDPALGAHGKSVHGRRAVPPFTGRAAAEESFGGALAAGNFTGACSEDLA